jgi:hypothetical protein
MRISNSYHVAVEGKSVERKLFTTVKVEKICRICHHPNIKNDHKVVVVECNTML